MGEYTSKAEIESRVLQIADAIACGLTKRSVLLQLASENEWDISDRQVDTYISKARELFKERKIEDIDTKRRKRIKQLDHLIQANYAKGDFTEARHCIKAASDLDGLVQSRFRDEEDTEKDSLTVVSRFSDKWKKVGG